MPADGHMMNSRAETSLGKDEQLVTAVRHWTDRLFSFRVTRPRSLRFRSGEFVMIGLMGENGRPLLRAYSISSPSWDEELEFYAPHRYREKELALRRFRQRRGKPAHGR